MLTLQSVVSFLFLPLHAIFHPLIPSFQLQPLFLSLSVSLIRRIYYVYTQIFIPVSFERFFVISSYRMTYYLSLRLFALHKSHYVSTICHFVRSSAWFSTFSTDLQIPYNTCLLYTSSWGKRAGGGKEETMLALANFARSVVSTVSQMPVLTSSKRSL